MTDRDVIDEPGGVATGTAHRPSRRVDRSRVAAFAVLPALALLLAGTAGFLHWQANSEREADIARSESVQAARQGIVAMLSYRPDTAEQQLRAARTLLTGDFARSYTSLTEDVVIPGATSRQVVAQASVPAAASVAATAGDAVVLAFVDQSVAVGRGVPTDTASRVRVTLHKVGARWLISQFVAV